MSLIAEAIHVTLGRAEILRGVDFTAKAGEFTAIVGPNGSGKTTLMRALTGEIRPRSGSITLGGHDISRTPPETLAQMRAVLPQATALSFPFTVSEIVRIGAEASGASDTLIPQALAAVDLPGFAGRLYQQLSGGEQQRVQLARVLMQVWQPVGAMGARWLFLDEPVSSLDIAHQLTVMRLAQNYARRGGGVVAVMHDLNLTAMFAQRITMLSGGEVAAQGAPSDVLADAVLSNAYGCRLNVNTVPEQGIWVLPHMAI